MTSVFADTGFYIAVLLPSDRLHAKANAVLRSLGSRMIVTSEMVLPELLNDFGGRGQHARLLATRFVADLRTVGSVRIVPQTPELFARALTLYTQRPDKSWSLTDCASMVICQQEGITDVLTHDRHFPQAGFVALLRDLA
jgi:predicted nucleic acid-binding protein